ncbi:MAG: DNA helicase RecQ [Alphaproteobacteria bacterium]|nr:DNA helicase RecQ [Alphaproteobacteria bacterium]
MTGTNTQARKLDLLRGVFGFGTFRPGQEAIVDAILAGRPALAVMPTGSGKSLCYQLPALVFDGLTVVVSPLIALMQDQISALKLAGVEAETINSSRPRPDNVAAWHRVAAGTTRLLYLSPERLMTERMLAAIGRLPLKLVVVDEAHCISQWGPGFRPEYAALARLKESFPGVPIAAFTATADAITRQDIAAKLFAGGARTFVAGFDRPNIHLAVDMKRDGRQQLLDFLAPHAGRSGIVYCLSRAKTEATAATLAGRGFQALPYHAGMEAAARSRNQDRFLAEPGVVMVATIAFGMGIDKPDLRFVFHTDIPGSIEAYYQEIGRAGRDGAPAEARMLYGLDDIRVRRQFIDREDSDDERKRREHQRLDALIGYCEAPECRRRTLLAYFGERIEPCGNCDVCNDPIPLADGTHEGRMALSAVVRTGERFGTAHVIDVLAGTATARVARLGHDRLPTFGIGAAREPNEWRSIVRQLVAAGFLRLDIAGYGGLKATESGRALLRSEKEFRYRPDAARSRPRAKKRGRAKPAALASTDAEAPLLAALKTLRLALARERGVPAYAVFSDRSLADMAARRPRTRDEFAAVHGVGQAKLDRFAAPFLAAIAAAADGST